MLCYVLFDQSCWQLRPGLARDMPLESHYLPVRQYDYKRAIGPEGTGSLRRASARPKGRGG